MMEEKKKPRNNRQMKKKNSCKSHTRKETRTRTHIHIDTKGNTNVLSKFILRIAFLTSV